MISLPKNCNKRNTYINFTYEIDESVINTDTSQGNTLLGWAPAFHPKTDKNIGYITFSYESKKIYKNPKTPIGFMNSLELFFVFDRFQTKKKTLNIFSATIVFETTLPEQRLPVGTYNVLLKSDSFNISNKSCVKLVIEEGGTRRYSLKIVPTR